MKKREIKIPPGDARDIGGRLKQRLRHHRQRHPESLDQQWLAEQLGVSKAMVNKMIKHGGGSFAGWRKACLVVDTDMDFVAFGMRARAHGSDDTFGHMLRANQELAQALDELRRERDRLLEQVGKLQFVK